jgi:ribonucleotide reductase alpha subunit
VERIRGFGVIDHEFVRKNHLKASDFYQAPLIAELQARLERYPQAKIKIVHLFSKGFYARVAKIPAGTVFVSKIHKTRHFHALVSGTIRLTNAYDEVKEYTGPHSGLTQIGTQRAAYTVTDCAFMTVHKTNKTNLLEIEDEVIAKERDELCLG